MLSLRFVGIATLASLFCFALSAAAGPILTIEEAEFDFGYAPQNSKVTHQFWLHNTGDDSLHITKVVPGCGCTQAPLEQSHLAPGDSTRLEIIFSTKHYRHRLVKKPRIETNEGPPHQNVTIITDVVPRSDTTYPLIFSPFKVEISQFGETIRDRTEFKISNVSDLDLTLTVIDRPDRLFDLELPKTVRAGETVEGLVTLYEETISQAFETSVTIELNDEYRTRFTVPIKRQIRNPGASSAALDTKAE